MSQINAIANNGTGQLVSYDAYLKSLDRTRTTGWRWRKIGLIETINVFGKLYVTRESIRKFEERAIAGDFAQTSTLNSVAA